MAHQSSKQKQNLISSKETSSIQQIMQVDNIQSNSSTNIYCVESNYKSTSAMNLKCSLFMDESNSDLDNYLNTSLPCSTKYLTDEDECLTNEKDFECKTMNNLSKNIKGKYQKNMRASKKNKFFKSKIPDEKTLMNPNDIPVINEAMKKIFRPLSEIPDIKYSPKVSLKTYSNKHKDKSIDIVETFGLPDEPLVPSINTYLIGEKSIDLDDQIADDDSLLVSPWMVHEPIDCNSIIDADCRKSCALTEEVSLCIGENLEEELREGFNFEEKVEIESHREGNKKFSGNLIPGGNLGEPKILLRPVNLDDYNFFKANNLSPLKNKKDLLFQRLKNYSEGTHTSNTDKRINRILQIENSQSGKRINLTSLNTPTELQNRKKISETFTRRSVRLLSPNSQNMDNPSNEIAPSYKQKVGSNTENNLSLEKNHQNRINIRFKNTVSSIASIKSSGNVIPKENTRKIVEPIISTRKVILKKNCESDRHVSSENEAEVPQKRITRQSGQNLTVDTQSPFPTVQYSTPCKFKNIDRMPSTYSHASKLPKSKKNNSSDILEPDKNGISVKDILSLTEGSNPTLHQKSLIHSSNTEECSITNNKKTVLTNTPSPDKNMCLKSDSILSPRRLTRQSVHDSVVRTPPNSSTQKQGIKSYAALHVSNPEGANKKIVKLLNSYIDISKAEQISISTNEKQEKTSVLDKTPSNDTTIAKHRRSLRNIANSIPQLKRREISEIPKEIAFLTSPVSVRKNRFVKNPKNAVTKPIDICSSLNVQSEVSVEKGANEKDFKITENSSTENGKAMEKTSSLKGPVAKHAGESTEELNLTHKYLDSSNKSLDSSIKSIDLPFKSLDLEITSIRTRSTLSKSEKVKEKGSEEANSLKGPKTKHASKFTEELVSPHKSVDLELPFVTTRNHSKLKKEKEDSKETSSLKGFEAKIADKVSEDHDLSNKSLNSSNKSLNLSHNSLDFELPTITTRSKLGKEKEKDSKETSSLNGSDAKNADNVSEDHDLSLKSLNLSHKSLNSSHNSLDLELATVTTRSKLGKEKDSKETSSLKGSEAKNADKVSEEHDLSLKSLNSSHNSLELELPTVTTRSKSGKEKETGSLKGSEAKNADKVSEDHDLSNKSLNSSHKSLNLSHNSLDLELPTVTTRSKSGKEKETGSLKGSEAKNADKVSEDHDLSNKSFNSSHKSLNLSHNSLDLELPTVTTRSKSGKEKETGSLKGSEAKNADKVSEDHDLSNKSLDSSHKSLNFSHNSLDLEPPTVSTRIKLGKEKEVGSEKSSSLMGPEVKNDNKVTEDLDVSQKSHNPSHKSLDLPHKTLDPELPSVTTPSNLSKLGMEKEKDAEKTSSLKVPDPNRASESTGELDSSHKSLDLELTSVTARSTLITLGKEEEKDSEQAISSKCPETKQANKISEEFDLSHKSLDLDLPSVTTRSYLSKLEKEKKKDLEELNKSCEDAVVVTTNDHLETHRNFLEGITSDDNSLNAEECSPNIRTTRNSRFSRHKNSLELSTLKSKQETKINLKNDSPTRKSIRLRSKEKVGQNDTKQISTRESQKITGENIIKSPISKVTNTEKTATIEIENERTDRNLGEDKNHVNIKALCPVNTHKEDSGSGDKIKFDSLKSNCTAEKENQEEVYASQPSIREKERAESVDECAREDVLNKEHQDESLNSSVLQIESDSNFESVSNNECGNKFEEVIVPTKNLEASDLLDSKNKLEDCPKIDHIVSKHKLFIKSDGSEMTENKSIPLCISGKEIGENLKYKFDEKSEDLLNKGYDSAKSDTGLQQSNDEQQESTHSSVSSIVAEQHESIHTSSDVNVDLKEEIEKIVDGKNEPNITNSELFDFGYDINRRTSFRKILQRAMEMSRIELEEFNQNQAGRLKRCKSVPHDQFCSVKETDTTKKCASEDNKLKYSRNKSTTNVKCADLLKVKRRFDAVESSVTDLEPIKRSRTKSLYIPKANLKSVRQQRSRVLGRSKSVIGERLLDGNQTCNKTHSKNETKSGYEKDVDKKELNTRYIRTRHKSESMRQSDHDKKGNNDIILDIIEATKEVESPSKPDFDVNYLKPIPTCETTNINNAKNEGVKEKSSDSLLSSRKQADVSSAKQSASGLQSSTSSIADEADLEVQNAQLGEPFTDDSSQWLTRKRSRSYSEGVHNHIDEKGEQTNKTGLSKMRSKSVLEKFKKISKKDTRRLKRIHKIASASGDLGGTPLKSKGAKKVLYEFKVGDSMWGKVGSYPYWPCLIVQDPESSQFKKYKLLRTTPYYHVRFFGDNGKRAWTTLVIPYEGPDDLEKLSEKLWVEGVPTSYIKEYYCVKPTQQEKWKQAVTEAEQVKNESLEAKINFFNKMFTRGENNHACKEDANKKGTNKKLQSNVESNNMKVEKGNGEIALHLSPKKRVPMKESSVLSCIDTVLNRYCTSGDEETSSEKSFKSVASRSKSPRKRNKPKNQCLGGITVDNSGEHGECDLGLQLLEFSRKIGTKPKTSNSNKSPTTNTVPSILSPSKICDDNSSDESLKCLAERLKTIRNRNRDRNRTIIKETDNVEKNVESDLGLEVLGISRLTDGISSRRSESNVSRKTFSMPSNTRLANITSSGSRHKHGGAMRKSEGISLSHSVSTGFDRDLESPSQKYARSRSKSLPRIRRMDVPIDFKRKSELHTPVRELKQAVSLISIPPKLRERKQVQQTDQSDCESKASDTSFITSNVSQSKKKLFKGITKEKVCQICEKSNDVIKCRGPCNGDYHIKCIEKSLKSTEEQHTSKVEGSASSLINRSKNEQVQIITVESKKKLLPDNITFSPRNTKLSLTEQIDRKMKEIMNQVEAQSSEFLESTDSGGEDMPMKTSENTKCKNSLKSQKPKAVFKHVTADDVSIISLSEEGSVEQKSVQIEGSEVASDVPIDESMYKCPYCISSVIPPCFVCNEVISKKGNEMRQRCSLQKCGKYYHLDCLKIWPQTQWSFILHEKRKTEALDSFVCPRHVCHICASENLGSSIGRCPNDKVVKCLRCPATYHNSYHCVPAGTQILTSTQIICPRHVQDNGRKPLTLNTIWCFVCSEGGNLICCETCPTSVHAECLPVNLMDDDTYICEDCESGRFPLYDEVVWVKCGSFRWWPAIILFPSEVPPNVETKPHSKEEFVVKFFGTYDYYWVGRGRTFLYQEGDTGCLNSNKNRIDEAFSIALKEAAGVYKFKKESKSKKDKVVNNGLKPPSYVRIKVNRPVGNVRVFDGNLSNTTSCDCNPKDSNPCGPNSNCLNRILLTECNPEVCPAGQRCKNQSFEKREYPQMIPYRTAGRGWGLKTLEPVKKGQFVIEYVGEIIDDEEYQRRIKRMHQQKDENYYFLTIDKDRMLDAGPKGNVARFMNHSCQPNCETQKWTVNGDTRVGLFALDDIPRDTELTFNYNLECIGTDKKICRCGAPNCSGYIGVKPDDQGPPKRSRVRKKKQPENIEEEVLKNPCFICGKLGDVAVCSNKLCLKSYHLNCVQLDAWPDGKWTCPSHNCNICSRRTIRSCVKCTNSFCPVHSEGNVRHDSKLGFICHQHDPVRRKRGRPKTSMEKVGCPSGDSISKDVESFAEDELKPSSVRSERYRKRLRDSEITNESSPKKSKHGSD